jgi:hypothetical protein
MRGTRLNAAKMKHLPRLDAFHKRVWMRLMDEFGRIRCFTIYSDAFKRTQKEDASKRVCILFFGKRIVQFAQIRTASPSISHDGQLFLEAYEQDKYSIFIHTLKLCGERG